jgi:hypothetical protein
MRKIWEMTKMRLRKIKNSSSNRLSEIRAHLAHTSLRLMRSSSTWMLNSSSRMMMTMKMTNRKMKMMIR